jgi:hypothetical protein
MIRSSATAHLLQYAGEVNNKPSMTIPDQTMSIREIMNRYARGLPIAGEKFPLYEGDDDENLPDLSRMDKIEKIEATRRIQDEVLDIQKKYEDDKKKSDRAKMIKEVQDKHNKDNPPPTTKAPEVPKTENGS